MPGWDWRWHAEIEAFPSAVLRARHPKSVNLGDVSAPDFVERAAAVGRPDVIVFGSPCQDFSVAGRRVGLDGDRGNLALVALGVVRRLRSRWFVFENVPGLFSSYSGSAEAERQVREGPVGGRADCEEDSDFAAFLSAVRECGYLGCYRVLDAQHSGVPQRRRRIFFVGHLGDWRPAAAVLLEPDSLRGDRPPRREKGEGIAGSVKSSLERCSADEAECGTIVAANPDIAWALQERDAKGADSSTKEGHLIVHPTAFSCKDHGADATEEQAPTLRAMEFDASHANGGGQLAVAFQTRIARNGRGQPDEIVPALNGADAGATSDMRPMVATSTAVRRLTPRECERLQSFPDDYTAITVRGKPAADGPRYKALGNSMCVNDVRWILQRIERYEAEIMREAAQ